MLQTWGGFALEVANASTIVDIQELMSPSEESLKRLGLGTNLQGSRTFVVLMGAARRLLDQEAVRRSKLQGLLAKSSE